MAKNRRTTAQKSDWHPADILAALHKRGVTLKGLAAEHELADASTLSKAMLHSYPASERRIADAIGVHPAEIWPSRYHDDGSPRKRGIRALKSTRVNCQRNGNSALAV